MENDIYAGFLYAPLPPPVDIAIMPLHLSTMSQLVSELFSFVNTWRTKLWMHYDFTHL
jgi:hypothetical protein